MRRLFIFFIGLSTFCFSYVSFGADLSRCFKEKCVAIVDAGSTGSRLHVYAINKENANAATKAEELWSHKTRPGFASLDPTADSVTTYLNTLFNETPDSKISVYFYATAGMRLVSDTTQSKLYGHLKQWFNTQANWQLVEAKTITGKEEGIFGWLSINYQLNKFNDKEDDFAGVMDMGGASVQVAFPVKDSDYANPDDIAEIEFNGKKTKLFVHSFLGLGQNVFAYQFLDEKSCFADQYKLPNGLIGEGDSESCQMDVTKLINVVHDVNERVQPSLIQNSPKSWYAMGGIQYLVEDPVFHFKNNQFTSQSLLEEASMKVCRQSWPSLAKDNPDNLYIHNYCLYSSFYYALVVNGYGIYPEQEINLLSQTNATDDWTLGAVLLLS